MTHQCMGSAAQPERRVMLRYATVYTVCEAPASILLTKARHQSAILTGVESTGHSDPSCGTFAACLRWSNATAVNKSSLTLSTRWVPEAARLEGEVTCLVQREQQQGTASGRKLRLVDHMDMRRKREGEVHARPGSPASYVSVCDCERPAKRRTTDWIQSATHCKAWEEQETVGRRR